MRKNDKKKAVLIVEDNRDMQLLLATILSDEGFQVHQAYEAKTALESYSRFKPEIVLMDYKLPGMNGLEIFSRMKIIKQDVIAFIITAYGDYEIEKEAKRLGAHEYLTKPFNNLELVRKIKFTLDSST